MKEGKTEKRNRQQAKRTNTKRADLSNQDKYTCITKW